MNYIGEKKLCTKREPDKKKAFFKLRVFLFIYLFFNNLSCFPGPSLISFNLVSLVVLVFFAGDPPRVLLLLREKDAFWENDGEM